MRAAAASICLTMILAGCAGEATPTALPTAHDPYPYTTPTPPAEPTSIDGIYARIVTADALGGAGACRRCPPYRLAVGEDILGLENGVFEVYHRGSGYVSVGHYTIDGSDVTLFNDPNCPQDRGTYRFTSEDAGWSFVAVDDPCAYDNVREQFLTSVPWMRLEPPEGVYTSEDGAVLVLLKGEFTLTFDGLEIAGTTVRAGDLITFEGPTCRQEVEWSVNQRILKLATVGPVCPADWVVGLVENQWAEVG